MEFESLDWELRVFFEEPHYSRNHFQYSEFAFQTASLSHSAGCSVNILIEADIH